METPRNERIHPLRDLLHTLFGDILGRQQKEGFSTLAQTLVKQIEARLAAHATYPPYKNLTPRDVQNEIVSAAINHENFSKHKTLTLLDEATSLAHDSPIVLETLRGARTYFLYTPNLPD